MDAVARPGGSMLNAAVSLGRCGIPVEFVSSFGTDRAGNLIGEFLTGNHVSIGYSGRHETGKTTIALAFLDSNKDASYSFYKQNPKERPVTELPVPAEGDLVLFGSYYAVSAETRDIIVHFLKSARDNGAILIYDLNFRKPHMAELEELLPRMIHNIASADIVRASDEDCSLVFSAGSQAEAFAKIREYGCSTLIYTRSKEGATVIRNSFSLDAPATKLDPVSTVGAGDAFNAGLIFSLSRYGINKQTIDDITAMQWKSILETGIRFSSDVCMSLDNYISPGLAGKMQEEWKDYQSSF
jgi:fructokinase